MTTQALSLEAAKADDFTYLDRKYPYLILQVSGKWLVPGETTHVHVALEIPVIQVVSLLGYK